MPGLFDHLAAAVRPGRGEPGSSWIGAPDPLLPIPVPVLLHDLASPAAAREEASGDDRGAQEERQGRDGRRDLRHGGLGRSRRRTSVVLRDRRRQGSEDDLHPVERGAGARGVVGEGVGGRTPSRSAMAKDSAGPAGRGRRPPGGSRSTIPSPADDRSDGRIRDRMHDRHDGIGGRRPGSPTRIHRIRRPRDAVGRRTPGLRNDHEDSLALEDRPDRRVGTSPA